MGKARYAAYREKIEELLNKKVSPVDIERMGEYHGKVPLSAIRFWKFTLDHPTYRKKGPKTSKAHTSPSSDISSSRGVQDALEGLVEAIKQSIKESL